MNLNIVNAVLFQLGWFACVFGGDLNALIWTIPYLILHFSCITTLRGEWKFVVAVAAIGIAVDSLNLAAGIFAVEGPMLFPIWLACLWLLFATFIPHGLSWLSGRPVLAALFGAVGGSMSYLAGIKIGVASTDNLSLAMVVWATQWAIMLPLALAAAQRWLVEPQQARAGAGQHAGVNS
jgi:hypothetical protein